ncbi:uncharacterized protein LOC111089766, partial [Limulus polyphemus]|uniref:Uncharacterized protein LOC111089766 n=1 Tax=Limulus polyphemus TaxID=6850 RepID=A0ABM1TRL0_LIMPO
MITPDSDVGAWNMSRGPIPYRRPVQPKKTSTIISPEIPNQKSPSIVSQSSLQGTVFGICRYLRPAEQPSSTHPQPQQSSSIRCPDSKFQQSINNDALESRGSLCNEQKRVRNSNSISSEGSRNSQYSVQNSSIYFDDENWNDQDEYTPGNINECYNTNVNTPDQYPQSEVNECYNTNVNTPDQYPQSEVNECYNVNVKAPQKVIVSSFHDFCQTMLSVDGVEGDTFGNSLSPSEIRSKEKVNPKTNTTQLQGFSVISNNRQELSSDHNKLKTHVSTSPQNPRLCKPPESTPLQAHRIHVSTSPHFTFSNIESCNTSRNSEKQVKNSLVPKKHANNNVISNLRSIEIQKSIENKLSLPKSLSSPSLQSPGIVKEVLKKMANHSNSESCSPDFIFLDEHSGRNYQYSSKDHGRSDAEALRIIQDLDRSLDEALPPSNESTPVSQSKNPHFGTPISRQNRSPVEVEDHESQTDNLVEEIYLPSNNKKSNDGLQQEKTRNQKVEDKKQPKQKFRRTTDAAVNTVLERPAGRTVNGVGPRRNNEPPKSSQEQANIQDTSLPTEGTSSRKKSDERPPVPPKKFSLSEELAQDKNFNG